MKPQVVSFHCVVKDRMGKLISSTFNRDVITDVEDPGPQLRGLAEGMRDLKQGERRTIRLRAEHAYGFYDPALVVTLPRSALKNGQALQAGDEVKGAITGGDPRIFRVVQTEQHRVVLDGNHPLAGQDLVFEIVTVEARDATAADLAERPGEVVIPAERTLH